VRRAGAKRVTKREPGESVALSKKSSLATCSAGSSTGPRSPGVGCS
jgi:hypothetical protein